MKIRSITKAGLTMQNRIITILPWTSGLFALAMMLLAGSTARSFETTCPFCTAASQTLRQEMTSMDIVAFGRLESSNQGEIDGAAQFKIEKLLAGEKWIKENETIGASYFGPGKSNKRFLLLGVDPRSLVWSSPLPLSPDAEKYVESIRKLPDNPIERLKFYQQYFEHADAMLARDCYDEFALAPYSDVILLKDSMDRKQLLQWVQDPSKSPDRKRLYFTMLGICGKPEDVPVFESMITSKNPEARAGLDALLAAYLTLKGEAGLKLIEEQFFQNKETQYADIYSAVMALRFHGTEVNQLPKEGITKAMHKLLERPELADLVIPDLARWGDWSQLDKLAELFAKANDENSWVRVPVINYMRACPLPEAKAKLAELEKIDPSAVKRARTFFPIPTPAAPKKNDSSMVPKKSLERQVRLDRNRKETRIASLEGISLGGDRGKGVPDSVRFAVEPTTFATVQIGEEMNLFAPVAVMVIATVMMAIVMWTIATSGGTSIVPLTLPRRA